VIIKFNFSITIPDRLIWPFVTLVLFYRRIRYGYPFRRIPLTQGRYAIVDPEDYKRLNEHKWHAIKSKNTFYATRRIHLGKNKWKHIKMHREILDPPDHLYVDHINHKGFDNRKANIRTATHRQNSYNRIHFRKNPQKRMMRQLVNSTENSHHLILNVKFEILNLRCEILAAKSRSLSGWSLPGFRRDGTEQQSSIIRNSRF
jgi:hypothetical protein